MFYWGSFFFVIFHLKSVKNDDGVVVTQICAGLCTVLKNKIHSLLKSIKYNYKFGINIKWNKEYNPTFKMYVNNYSLVII